METARGLLVMVACALKFLHMTERADQSLDPSSIEDLAEMFSFSEIRKRTLHTRFSFVLCDTVGDKDTFLNYGGIILPLGNMILFLNFAPIADDTIRTSLSKEIRIALSNHKDLFYQGGMVLSVDSSIPALSTFIFQIALLTLLGLEQADQSPTPAERPREVSDIIANVAPQGHAP